MSHFRLCILNAPNLNRKVPHQIYLNYISVRICSVQKNRTSQYIINDIKYELVFSTRDIFISSYQLHFLFTKLQRTVIHFPHFPLLSSLQIQVSKALFHSCLFIYLCIRNSRLRGDYRFEYRTFTVFRHDKRFNTCNI